MCGITGIYSFTGKLSVSKERLQEITQTLKHRGPDFQDTYHGNQAALGHTRLSIIDTSAAANQPMWDQSERYVIVYNGEIYNHKELREQLKKKGRVFRSSSDTEVVLQAYLEFGTSCLSLLDGFFAFGIYDTEAHKLFLARDRFGIKPLYIYQKDDQLIFASEMHALRAYSIPWHVDFTSLFTYLQLNYVPAPHSMIQGVEKLLPGHALVVSKEGSEVVKYYDLQQTLANSKPPKNYEDAKVQLRLLLSNAVENRLFADVKLGVFLSGGIDSSIIAALAAKYQNQLSTFSMGFSDQPYFDETQFAELQAKQIGSNHHSFQIQGKDVTTSMDNFLAAIDEPFADSSSIAMYHLSKKCKKYVKVALSGDGGDELFAGYQKHRAEWLVRRRFFVKTALGIAGPLFGSWNASRKGVVANKIRQLQKMARGTHLGHAERYWQWACFLEDKQARELLLNAPGKRLAEQRGKNYTKAIATDHFNEVLLADLHLVLTNDMLKKVDLNSMAHGLEVRTPFLDHKLVEWVSALPDQYKITSYRQKKILVDAFSDLLPHRIKNRSKKGFEVPLRQWLLKDLHYLMETLLGPQIIEEQRFFDPSFVAQKIKQLKSSNPGDAASHLWNLIVFQNWWIRNEKPN